MKYFEKLKDPRWQKLRLKILERDEFVCQNCYDSENTLHVHHLNYIWNKEPWDYHIDDLLTLCEDCHEYEKNNMKKIENDLIQILKSKSFLADDILNIMHGFYKLNVGYPHDVTSSIIEYILSNDKLMEECGKKFFDSISKRRKK